MLRSSRTILSRAALVACLAAAAIPAHAATRVWPVLIGPGCNGSLQQCIDGAIPGDTVRIIADDFLTSDSYTAVNEDLLIGKSLTLEAAPGIDAVLTRGRIVQVESPASGPITVTLRRLVVRAGRIRVTHLSDGAGSYTLDEMRVEEAAGGGGSCGIQFRDFGTGTPSFVVSDSVLRFRNPQAANPFALCAFGNGESWQVSFFRNHIESENGALSAGMTIGGTSSGAVTLSENQLFLHGAPRGILYSQNAGSTANILSIHDNLLTGHVDPAPVAQGAVQLQLTNTELRFANNTIFGNSHGVRIAYTAPDASFGRIANNIIAFNSLSGLIVEPGFTAIANDHNLVFGNGANEFVAGAATITTDPQFVSGEDPRLRSSSPARDTGNNADVPLSPGIFEFEGDGEHRFVNGRVDIGAFEWNGDQSVRHVANPATTAFNSTELDTISAATNSVRVLLTPLRGPVTGAELEETLGVFQALNGSSQYFAFHEDTGATLSPGRRIHAFAPLFGVTGFLHTTTVGSVVDAYSRITHPELDSRPGAIAIITHNWNPGGGVGTYHDRRIGLDYSAPNWFVGNQDGVLMQSGRAFNIAVAPVGSPNAFVRVGPSSPATELRLEHPLLDDNRCATPQVSRTGSTLNNTAFTLEYRVGGFGAPGHWFIVAEGAGTPTFPANAAFNVMIPGAQANACRINRLFSDGFE